MPLCQATSIFHSTGYISLWCGDLGGDPSYREGTGVLPSQVDATYKGEESAVMSQHDMGLTPDGVVHEGSRPGKDGDIYLHAPEYGHAINLK